MAGIIFKIWFVDHFKVLSTVLYLTMGWLVVVAILAHVSGLGLRWLVAGGVIYTLGVVFYASDESPTATQSGMCS